MGIREIIRGRDALRHAEALPLASSAIRCLREAGFQAWLVGSIARGDFLQHSDIDILIDTSSERRSHAIRICLHALHGFPSSIIFKSDLPAHALVHFMAEAADEPRLRA
jgi:predicted nucleotidyltransferase